jgi:hypothetical protein
MDFLFVEGKDGDGGGGEEEEEWRNVERSE